MSSCDNSNIKQNYIVTNTNEFETLTACTGIWTSNIYGCSPITIRDQLKLNSVSNNNTLNRILVINNLTGLVQYRNINSIISGSSGISDFTYDNENTFTITDTSGNILSSTIDVMSGLTINGVLSATTYQGLPLDIYVTGGTYFDGDLTLTNNSGGTFNIGGFYTGQTNYVNSLTTGVGLSANTTTGNISIINTYPDQVVTISGGTGILTGGAYPNFTIENTLPDQTVILNNGTNISVTGTYPNFTIDVTGLTDNNTYTTGFTYQDNTFTISDTSGNTLSTTIDVMTGLTINGGLSATTISGGTLYGDGSNLTGLLSGLNVGVTQITNGTSGRVLFQSGTTLQQSSNLFWNNADGRLSIGQGSTPQARLHVANADKTLTTGLFSGSGQNILSVVGSGSTQPLFTVKGSSGELFSVTDSLIGSLFSVNDISGLPVLEVFSDNTILMGSYQSPSLNTTLKKTITAGLTTLYSIPLSAYTGGFFDYTLIGYGARSGTIMSIFSGSTVNYSESATSDIGNTSQVTFNMDISGNSANLNVSATTGNWVIKTIVRGI
jgi:hypothetical protein